MFHLLPLEHTLTNEARRACDFAGWWFVAGGEGVALAEVYVYNAARDIMAEE